MPTRPSIFSVFGLARPAVPRDPYAGLTGKNAAKEKARRALHKESRPLSLTYTRKNKIYKPSPLSSRRNRKARV